MSQNKTDSMCSTMVSRWSRIGKFSISPKIILNLNQRPQSEYICAPPQPLPLGFTHAQAAFMELVVLGTSSLGKGTVWEIYLLSEVGADFLRLQFVRRMRTSYMRGKYSPNPNPKEWVKEGTFPEFPCGAQQVFWRSISKSSRDEQSGSAW